MSNTDNTDWELLKLYAAYWIELSQEMAAAEKSTNEH